MKCLDCGRDLREVGEPAEVGTVVHTGRSLCSNDYKRHRIAGTLGQFPRLDGKATRRTQAEIQDAGNDPRRHERNVEGLVAFIRARRERGWPNDGTLDGVEGLEP